MRSNRGLSIRRRLSIVLAGLAATTAAVTIVAIVRRGGGGEALPPDVGVVDWVVDGDTIDIEIAGREERVRMIGVDTPELHTDSGEPECMAREALSFTARQLPSGAEVRLERDVVGRDDYGRLLAYVFRRRDGVQINELIVAAGFARPLTIAPNDAYRDRFVAAARAAESAGLGVWECAG